MTDLVLRLAVVGLLIYATITLLRPVLGIFCWAAVLAVALHPAHLGLTRLLRGRPVLSATLLTLAALIVVLGPIAALVASLVETATTVAERFASNGFRLPSAPQWVADLPLVGQPIASFWASAAINLEATLQPYAGTLMPHAANAMAHIAGFSLDVLGFVAAVLLVGPLLVWSDHLTRTGTRLISRIAPPAQGTHAVTLAVATIRGVSRGVVGVALIQAVLSGLVFEFFGVPGAGLLAFLILILCIVQVGMLPIAIPLLIWAWMTMPATPALLLTVLLVPISLLDNVLKPLLMSKGTSVPAVIMLLGVICGTMSGGLIGIFLGPVILATAFDLLQAWVTPPDGSSGITA